jgi:hypothetical protein
MSRERHEQTCTTPDCAAAKHPARRGHKPAVGPPVFRVVLFACLMLLDTGCALPSPAKEVLGSAGAPSEGRAAAASRSTASHTGVGTVSGKRGRRLGVHAH